VAALPTRILWLLRVRSQGANADAIDSLDHGDTAPNARFNFRHETAPP
jgi:hypothetical protein